MEPNGLERVISQRAVQMSRSSSCKFCVLGFFCGACITYLFLVAVTPYRSRELGLIVSSLYVTKASDSSLMRRDTSSNNYCSRILENPRMLLDSVDRIRLLYSAWCPELNNPGDNLSEVFLGQLNRSDVPRAPHLEDCRLNEEIFKQFDHREANGSIPPWTLWRGLMGLQLLQQTSTDEENHEEHAEQIGIAYPPWIVGSNEDNFPSTRRVQKDIWIHQHPRNCSDPKLRFLIADWETIPGFGMGAQLVGMSGLLSIAINENRILVSGYYNRADHSGCEGSSRSSWSCYFFPETSDECREQALRLMKSSDAWKEGIVTIKSNYTSKIIWSGTVPRVWGDPWKYLQPTTDVDGSLLTRHRKMNRRWWRAQAVRYLMRFQTEYTCKLVNVARHEAFGFQAAEMVIANLPASWPKAVLGQPQTDIERLVWSDRRPWIPRPLLSMHVRMGDKSSEMTVVEFVEYMRKAERIRSRFPSLKSIWLSTEMQDVVDKAKLHPGWRFYFTDVPRQVGNTSMAKYEASLGRERSTNYPLVNLILASEADFFVGALGSTWCLLIDGLRNTGGKVMAGYLSVNKNRFW